MRTEPGLVHIRRKDRDLSSDHRCMCADEMNTYVTATHHDYSLYACTFTLHKEVAMYICEK